jgi:hypothetical protein
MGKTYPCAMYGISISGWIANGYSRGRSIDIANIVMSASQRAPSLNTIFEVFKVFVFPFNADFNGVKVKKQFFFDFCFDVLQVLCLQVLYICHCRPP